MRDGPKRQNRVHPRQSHHPPEGIGRAGLRKRFRLFLTVIAIVLVLSAVKASIHRFRLEFLGLNPLFTSAIAGAIFASVRLFLLREFEEKLRGRSSI